MLIANTETVPGHRVTAFHGLATGSTVRAKHYGKDLMAGLKNLVGGELKGYTELLTDARNEALPGKKGKGTAYAAPSPQTRT